MIVDQSEENEITQTPCYTLFSPEIDNEEKRVTLGSKCLQENSPKFVFGLGGRAISVDDIKCGVVNATSETSILENDLCIADTTEKLGIDNAQQSIDETNKARRVVDS